ncbi:hypothetical protein C8Q80DRAFT_835200 [Daedaleopsis nitida]|nr:hypothetical protein C8Q80DRAFT_835200 [Daedaleopsis nitida]
MSLVNATAAQCASLSPAVPRGLHRIAHGAWTSGTINHTFTFCSDAPGCRPRLLVNASESIVLGTAAHAADLHPPRSGACRCGLQTGHGAVPASSHLPGPVLSTLTPSWPSSCAVHQEDRWHQLALYCVEPHNPIKRSTQAPRTKQTGDVSFFSLSPLHFLRHECKHLKVVSSSTLRTRCLKAGAPTRRHGLRTLSMRDETPDKFDRRLSAHFRSASPNSRHSVYEPRPKSLDSRGHIRQGPTSSVP